METLHDLGKWWVLLGFPDFDMGDDGFPVPGQVVKHYRKLKMKEDGKAWTQDDLALVLGKKPLAIMEMENKGIGLRDIELRRFLADLFDIPLMLFGILSIDDIKVRINQQVLITQQKVNERIVVTPRTLYVNVSEFKEALQLFWQMNHARTAGPVVTEVAARLSELYQALPVQREEAQEIMVLMCRYHILYSSIVEDLKDFAAALDHANRALCIAEEAQLYEYQALSFYRKASICHAQEECVKTSNFAAAQEGFRAAYDLRKHLSPALQHAALLKLGLVQAKTAGSNTEKSTVLKLIQPVGSAVRNGFSEDIHALKLNQQRYHLDKAAALIAIGWADQALDELALIPDSDDARRHAYRDLLYAQAYAQKTWYPTATTTALASLEAMIDIHSDVNIARLAKLQTELKRSPYSNNPEVALLGRQISLYFRQR